LTSARALLPLLAIVVAQPAVSPPPLSPPTSPTPPADKTLAVRLDPFLLFAGAAPAGWNEPGFDDRAWAGPSAGPFAPRQPPLPGNAQPPAGVTLFDAVPTQPLLLRARFAVPDAPRARVLELRVAYNDGFVAYVNGREVARRGVARSAVQAAAPHGPEVERVYVAVPDAVALTPDANLLAVAVYPYAGRNVVIPRAPSVMIGLAASSGVRIVRGPYLAAPAEAHAKTRMNVIWETDLPATGKVVLEPAPTETPEPTAGTVRTAARAASATRAPREVVVRAPATRQLVQLNALERGSGYRYRVEIEAAPGDTATSAAARFETLPAAPAPLRFAVYGDMRYPGHRAHRAVIEALAREAPALVINTGDLTDVGSEESNWQRYFDITAPLAAIAPIIPVLGNHDGARGGAGALKTWQLFDMPQPAPPFYTSFDLGGVHFIALDTNDGGGTQRDWLEDDLARARRHQARAVFAFCHEPPWSHGLHGDSHRMVRDYAPLLVAGHVDVLFCGHDHIYERGAGPTPKGKLTYIITGGGGAPLYNPRCQAASGPPPGDVPGPLPQCPATVAALTKAYHYVMVTVAADGIQLCPRRPDGSAVEPCVALPPHRR
jgi:predicted phosphodiesterase